MMDVMIMIDDHYRNRDDHYGSASSAVKSSFSSFARHHTSSSSATTHGNLRRFTERNTLRPVILSFSLKETRKNIIKYLKIMKKWPKLGTRSHPPSTSIYKPHAARLRFAPRRRGGGLEGVCRAEVDSRTAASPRGETIAVQQWQRISWSGNARRPLATLTWVKEEGEGHIAVDVLRWNL